MSLIYGSATHKGNKCEVNQDAVFAKMIAEDIGVFAIVDGLGGKGTGHKAAEIIIGLISQYAQTIQVQNITDDLRMMFEDANLSIRNHTHGAGACLTIGIITDEKVTIAHIGDTRAYVFNSDSMTQITHDHTVEMQSVLSALFRDPDEPDIVRVLYRALGQNADMDEIDSFQHPFFNNSLLLLCSDGIHSGGKSMVAGYTHLTSNDIHDIILNSENSQAACDALIAESLKRGGTDDISVVIVSNGFSFGAARASDKTSSISVANPAS